MIKYPLLVAMLGWWLAGLALMLPRNLWMWSVFWSALLVCFGTVAFGTGTLYLLDLFAYCTKRSRGTKRAANLPRVHSGL